MSMRAFVSMVVVSAAFVAFPAVVHAGQEASSSPSAPVEEPSGVTAHGFASFGYTYNVNQPISGENQLRVFDSADRSLTLDVVQLVLQKPATASGVFGFRTDLEAGQVIPRASAASGLFRNASTGVSTTDFDVKQAFVSAVLPIGSGLHVDAGKFTTHVGAEVIEGYEGYGDNYSHSYLFGYAEPFTHTGTRASYTFSPVVSVTVLAVSGWDTFKDNNSGRSIGAQLQLTPIKPLTLYINYIGGPERADSADPRRLFNVVAVFKANDKLTVTSNVDLGRETNAAGPGVDGRWQGVSTSAKYDFSERFSLGLRGEVFADPTAVRTGAAQTLSEVTVTPGVKLAKHVILRGDLRFDHSTTDVFETRDGQSARQLTAALNALVVF
jgi:hypothetical protein